ncbi:MAG: discoidin domain-containing protein [Lentisphaeria bacterium]|nr:discoidin domain-containing protein [Lentisphaeria bacterium]
MLLISALFAQDKEPKKDPKKLKDSENKYLKIITVINSDYDKKVLSATKTYLNELSKLQVFYTKQGDLDSAVTVRARINEIKIPENSIKSATKSIGKEAQWISQKATYKTSSDLRKFKALAALLSYEGELHDGNDFAFHTKDKDKKPHIIIDLKKPMLIQRIEIQNRVRGSKGDAKGLTIWLTKRKATRYTEIWTTQDVEDDYTIILKTPIKAQYIKIGKSSAVLRLAHVKIFGWKK